MSIKTQPAALFTVASHGQAPELKVAKILSDQRVGSLQRIIGYVSGPKGPDKTRPYTVDVPVSRLLVQLVDGSERMLWMVGQSGEFLRQPPRYRPSLPFQSIH